MNTVVCTCFPVFHRPCGRLHLPCTMDWSERADTQSRLPLDRRCRIWLYKLGSRYDIQMCKIQLYDIIFMTILLELLCQLFYFQAFFFFFVSIVGHNLLSPYMEESRVGDRSPLLLQSCNSVYIFNQFTFPFSHCNSFF